MAAQKKAVVILSSGAEEMETVIVTDVLRRAKVQVVLAGLDSSSPVRCSRGVVIVPDMSLEEAMQQGPYDVVVLPGGAGGARELAASSRVKEVLGEQEKAGRIIAAVCAGPTALLSHGIAQGREVTSHPSVKKELEGCGQYRYSEARVVRDGTVITSRGPGTCFEFALCIVDAVCGSDVAKEVATPMIVK